MLNMPDPLGKRLLDFVQALLTLLLIYTLAALFVFIFIRTMNILSHVLFFLIKLTIPRVNTANEFWKTIQENFSYTIRTVNRLGRQ
jgi:hypothetical protein